MAKTFVIADIHGRYDLLEAAYALLGQEKPGLIVHLGDYVDRGKASSQVIEFLMAGEDTLPSPEWRRVILKGNHESMMVETIRKPLDPAWWLSNGGNQTLYSYGHPKFRGMHRGDIFPYNPGIVPPAHVDFLDALPLFFCDKQRVYVHACVDETRSLPEQKEELLLWGIYKNGNPGFYRGAHVVHGHEQVSEPAVLSGRTNLDIGAFYSGKLAIGVFDNEVPGGPIGIIEVTE